MNMVNNNVVMSSIGKVTPSVRMNILIFLSLILALCIIFFGGLKEKESIEIINLVLTMSITMAGFGLVALQIGHASNELKNDFIESSIILIASTITGFFYLVYPESALFGLNFGELSIFMFFWGLIILVITLIDRRFNLLK